MTELDAAWAEWVRRAADSGDVDFLRWLMVPGIPQLLYTSGRGEEFEPQTRARIEQDLEIILSTDPKWLENLQVQYALTPARFEAIRYMAHGSDYSAGVLRAVLALGLSLHSLSSWERLELLRDKLDPAVKRPPVTESIYFSRSRKLLGTLNPEDITDAYKLALLYGDENSVALRKRFNDPEEYGKGSAVWDVWRFGQSCDFLDDGRMILIGGWDDGFVPPGGQTFNDVIVIGPGQQVRVFGYPLSVFPRVSYHRTFDVGEALLILDVNRNRDESPAVYRLDLGTYAISKLPTSGDAPGPMQGCELNLVDTHLIRVSRIERRVKEERKPFQLIPKYRTERIEYTFLLDVMTGHWTLESADENAPHA